MVTQLPDGTITNSAGKVLHQPTNKWVLRIVDRERCFVCGEKKSTKPFNDEHVIPNWVLRRFNLHDKRATLPNGTTIKYGQYKIPCCVDCNSLLGRMIETPVSEISAGGIDAVSDFIIKEGPYLFCMWLSLLYFKLHYKDLTLAAYRNPNEGSGFIGDVHGWEEMHHVHTLATAPHSGVIVRPETIGTLAIFPGWSISGGEVFDFCDVSPARTIMVRLGTTVLFHNISDACALSGWLKENTKKIGAVNEVQARELCVRLAYGEMCLRNPPKHIVRQSLEHTDAIEVVSTHDPEPNFSDFDPKVFGALFELKLRDFSHLISLSGKIGAEALEKVAAGKVGFLWDEKGNFRDETAMRSQQSNQER